MRTAIAAFLAIVLIGLVCLAIELTVGRAS
jgi:hypothetical protein